MMGTDKDWSALAFDWQQQETPRIDIDVLRREVERRGRVLRRVVWMEVAFTALIALVCALIAFSPGSTRVETIMFAVMAVTLVVYQACMVRLRRGDLADTAGDALSLVDREILRGITVLRYWRWGMWTALAIWLVIYGVFLAGLHMDSETPRLGGLAGGLGINVLLFPLMGAYGWWRCRQARARIARFTALREQLRDA